jgi:hypothetical protein
VRRQSGWGGIGSAVAVAITVRRRIRVAGFQPPSAPPLPRRTRLCNVVAGAHQSPRPGGPSVSQRRHFRCSVSSGSSPVCCS